MKRLTILCSIIAAGLAAVGVTAQSPGVSDIERVSGNVYRVPGTDKGPLVGNMLVFERANDVVLVDTKLNGMGEDILSIVRKVTDKPVGMVINTHAHPDHVGSNPFFEGMDGVEIVAQVNSAEHMRNPRGPFPAYRVDKTFSNFMAIGEGDDRIELRYFGPGHTDGDAFVVFPAAKTMMAGDMYAWHMAPVVDYMSGGSVMALPNSLLAAYQGISGVDRVVTGHGEVRSWEEFGDYVNFINRMVRTAEETERTGGSPRAALAALKSDPVAAGFVGDVPMPGLSYGGKPSDRALMNLINAFQELRGEEPQFLIRIPPEGLDADE